MANVLICRHNLFVVPIKLKLLWVHNSQTITVKITIIMAKKIMLGICKVAPKRKSKPQQQVQLQIKRK